MDGIFEYLRRFNLPLPRTVVQVGASVGQELDYFHKNGIRAGLFIEALPEPFSMLHNACRGYSNYFPVNSLVSSRDNQSLNMYVASNFGQSSSILPPTRHKSVYPNVKFDKSFQTTGFRLDSIVNSARKSFFSEFGMLDLLFMDVQGAELEVLKGGTQILSEVKLIYTEVTYGTDYEEAVSYCDIDFYLRMHGFLLSSFEIDPSFRGHGNAIYVRKDGVHLE